MKKRRKRFFLLLLSVLIAAAIFAYFRLSGGEGQVSYLTGTARIGDIRKTVIATGQIGAVQMVNVGAQASGQIKKLYVELGQFVRENDMIAEIDSTTQTNDLDTAKARLASFQAQLTAKRIALGIAKAQFERENLLYKTDSTSRQNRETAENAYYAAQASVSELESQILQAQIAVNTAESNLGYTRITAPLDGTVVSIPVKEGQTVNANQTAPTIVQIADLSVMEIRIEIAEGDITKVRPGMPVEYSILSEPEAVFQAALASIDPALTSLSDGNYTQSAGSSAAVYYYAKAVVPNEDGRLRIGMTTRNTITVDMASQVIMVPSIAVFQRDGQPYVQLLHPDGRVEERDIRTGLSDNMNTRVVSGLAPGDEVILTRMTRAEIDANVAGGPRGPMRRR